MKYQKPNIEFIQTEDDDIITLSNVGTEDPDDKIEWSTMF